MTSSESHRALASSLQAGCIEWLGKLRGLLQAGGFSVPLSPSAHLDQPLTSSYGEPVLSMTAPGATWRESSYELAAVDPATGGVALFTLVFRSALLPSRQPGFRLGLELLLVVAMGREDDEPQLCQVFEVAPDESVHCALALELRTRALTWAASRLTAEASREALFEEVLDVLHP